MGADLLFVSFASPRRVEAYRREFALRAPVLIDRERKVYRAYGLRESLRDSILSPRIWLPYARLVVRRGLPRTSPESPRQLGGDFVIDPAGRLALARPTRWSTDRPDVETILDAARRARERAA